jgi:ceramide glucosyltransferase
MFRRVHGDDGQTRRATASVRLVQIEARLEAWLVLLPNVVAIALYAVVAVSFTFSLLRWRRRPGAIPERAPRVTILKPLAGVDDDLEANLESFAALDYPAFEILLGVSSASDPAYEAARRFVRAHPRLSARVVLTDPDAAVNPKVAQLIGLDARATGEVVVVSDSNVRVSPGHVWALVRELDQAGVGLVTSVFAGTGERSIGAALENLQLGAVTAPGVVAMAQLTRRPLTVGKSMAMWRRDLARLGGFRRVAQTLAEDHVLGRAFLDAGHGVRTSLDIVENRNVDCGVWRTFERHTRWAKIRRALHPAAFYAEPLLSPLATASIVAAIDPCRVAVALVAVTALLQLAFATLAMRLLRGHALAWYYAPLELARTYIALACWVRACVSRRLEWRGHAFVVKRDSVIEAAPPRSASRLRAALRV